MAKQNKNASEKKFSIQSLIDSKKRKKKRFGAEHGSPNAPGARSVDEQVAKNGGDINGPANSEDESFFKQYREQIKNRRPGVGNGVGNGQPAQPPAPNGGNGGDESLPSPGAILYLSTGQVAIFDRNVPSKDYQVLYLLHPDGTASLEGVNLFDDYEFRQIGLLRPEIHEEIQAEKTWNRDQIVYHLKSLKLASLIPSSDAQSQTAAPSSSPTPRPSGETEVSPPAPPETDENAPTADAPQTEAEPREEAESRRPVQPHKPAQRPGEPVRGQKIRIVFDKKREWEAIYWGKDERGTVLAHNTGGNWAFMHLDLDRFRDSLVIEDEILGEKEQHEIAQSVLKAQEDE